MSDTQVATTKHKKAAIDAKRSFAVLCFLPATLLLLCYVGGDPNPTTTLACRRCCPCARMASMPNAKIQAAIDNTALALMLPRGSFTRDTSCRCRSLR